MHIKRAPRRALTVLSEQANVSGIHLLTFAMPDGTNQSLVSIQPYDRRPVTMPVNPNDILLKTWERLDHATSNVMEGVGDSLAKATARAYASVIADMMPQFYADTDAVVREAVLRYKNKDNTEYETPGLGQETLAVFDTMPARTGPTKTASKSKLDAATQVNIKKALESGLFTAAQLASSYNVTVSDINDCVTA